jgi:hypothetical protein
VCLKDLCDGDPKPPCFDKISSVNRCIRCDATALPSIQVNIRAGKFPPAEADGVHDLKVP